MEGTSCVWHRRTCVTCYPDTDGKAMIRVQTNNMPDHCPGNSLVKPQEFDYEVLFNSPIVVSGNHANFMYGPYNDNGELWQTDDVDACNGVREDPLYYYVATQWYPYVPGCQGPTNMIHKDTLPFYATCSLNGIEQFQTPLKGLGEDCVANQHW
mmetsp:Transcript_11331/g.17256  ORF Transcript_11331/g.17256 Transcript_11331/m.17256 type:complete len:154 (+) Transcript_11331:267-728(+)